jgi:hypothetical protein
VRDEDRTRVERLLTAAMVALCELSDADALIVAVEAAKSYALHHAEKNGSKNGGGDRLGQIFLMLKQRFDRRTAIALLDGGIIGPATAEDRPLLEGLLQCFDDVEAMTPEIERQMMGGAPKQSQEN